MVVKSAGIGYDAKKFRQKAQRVFKSASRVEREMATIRREFAHFADRKRRIAKKRR